MSMQDNGACLPDPQRLGRGDHAMRSHSGRRSAHAPSRPMELEIHPLTLEFWPVLKDLFE
jgi:hypothetical protein